MPRIVFTKNYPLNSKEYKKGDELQVTNHTRDRLVEKEKVASDFKEPKSKKGTEK